MTLLQMKLTDAISRLGSISSAAKELGISQPNASKYLKQLEDELGFSVFVREGKSIVMTDKGSDFLYHARKIIEENKKIKGISEAEHRYNLRVGGMNHSVVINSFLRLCEEQKDNRNIDLRMLNCSADTGLKLLRDNKLDVFALDVLEELSGNIDRLCEKFGLVRIDIGELQAVVSLRKNHPLVKELKKINGPVPLSAYKDYPYVDYKSIESVSGLFNVDNDNMFEHSGLISVDDRDSRLSVVKRTDAFSLGVHLKKELTEKYGIVEFNVPGAVLYKCCIVRKGEQDKTEIKRFIEILKEEMKKQ